MHLQLKCKLHRSDHSLWSDTIYLFVIVIYVITGFCTFDTDVVTTCFRDLQAQEDGKQAYNGD